MKKVSVFIFLLVTIFVLNRILVVKMLRLTPEDKIIDKLMPSLISVRELLFLNYDIDDKFLRSFLKKTGIKKDQIQHVPRSHQYKRDLDWIEKNNPFPSLLCGVRDDYECGYITLGWLDLDGSFFQMTYYSGEADTTPSLLVPKVRKLKTGWGDYFVSYVVLLSQRLEPAPLLADNKTGQVLQWDQGAKFPTVENVNWVSYRGGSYNGFEELYYPLLFTILEGLVILCFFVRNEIVRFLRFIIFQKKAF